jgi:hypothetical protein
VSFTTPLNVKLKMNASWESTGHRIFVGCVRFLSHRKQVLNTYSIVHTLLSTMFCQDGRNLGKSIMDGLNAIDGVHPEIHIFFGTDNHK